MSDPFTPEIVKWAQDAQLVYQIPSSLNCSVGLLESNLGKSIPPASNNWHGIKAIHGNAVPTREQRPDGTWYEIESPFQVFKSPADSFMAYARLLGTGLPYNAAVVKYLASPRTPLDVVNLTMAIAVKYATALKYSTALVRVQQDYNLYRFDKLPVPLLAPSPSPAVPARQGPPDMNFISIFTGLLTNLPAEIQIVETGVADLQQLATNPAVTDFLNLFENLFHISPPTAGSAAVIEPKTTITTTGKIGAR